MFERINKKVKGFFSSQRMKTLALMLLAILSFLLLISFPYIYRSVLYLKFHIYTKFKKRKKFLYICKSI